MTTSNKEYVIIPNPIYDVVFRYLMADLESAKIIIATILNVKITTLKFFPDAIITNASETEITDNNDIPETDAVKDLRLLYIDFAAEIEKEDGKKEIILIEMQKARLRSDIYRFRRYLAANMQRKEIKTYIDPITKKKKQEMQVYKILPIYILNFEVEKLIMDPVLEVRRGIKGVFFEKKIEKEIEFVELLSYDLLIIQLPYVHFLDQKEYEQSEYKRALYALLKLFDQTAAYDERGHRLRILRNHFSPNELDR